MLTTGVDTSGILKGSAGTTNTDGNDVFNALGDTTGATLTAADSIDGGAGTDVLNVTFTAAAADATAGALIKNIEEINVRATAAAANSSETVLNASSTAGLTHFNANLSTNAVKVTNLATDAQVGIKGNGTVVNGGLNFSYKTATDAVTINLDGGVNQTAAVAAANGPANVGLGIFNAGSGATTATINSTGSNANTTGGIQLSGSASVTALTINAAAALTVSDGAAGAEIIGFGGTDAKITVAGAASNIAATATALEKGAVGLGLIEATTVKTIDASGLTVGGIEATLSANAAMTVTGGQGNDIITTGAVLTTGSVNAGAGTADKLIVATAADIATTTGAKYTGFEVLQNNTAGVLDVSTVTGITSVVLNNAITGATNMTATQAANVTVIQDITTSATLSLATATGTSDVLGLTLANTTATASADAKGLTINGFETLNVVSSSGGTGAAGDKNDLSFTSATDLTALNISGAKAIEVATGSIAKAATITAADLTYVGTTANDYALEISGNLVKGSSVTGTAAADNITTTAKVTGAAGDFVTYNTGAGNDVISTTVDAVNNTSGAFASVKIDGGAGTDSLAFKDTASLTMVDANFQYLTNIETLSYAVLNKAISITSGGFFDTNFKTNGVTLTLGDATNAQVNTVDLSTFSGNAVVELTATAASSQVQTINTGSGNDTVTLLAAGTTDAAHVINTGAGNDTINVTIAGATITTGSVTINAGAGKDTITITGNSTADTDTAANVIVKVAEGQSTLTDFDVINGATLSLTAGGKEAFQLDFGGASANANVAASSVTGYTAAELTYTVTNGLMAFAGTSVAALTAAQKATIAQTLITTANKAVVFQDGSDSYVFHNGATTDSLVQLVGVTVAGLGAATDGYIDIA